MKKETSVRSSNKYFTQLFAEFESNSIYDVLLSPSSSNSGAKLEISEKIKDFVKRSFQQNVTEDEFHYNLSLIPKKKDSVIQELISSCLLKMY
jgi:hypothetical protein